MLRQRLSTTRGRLLLLVISALVTLACSSGEALATVPVNGPGGWQSSGFYVTVTDGYSYNNGASMSCSGSNGAYETYYGAGPDSGGVLMEQQWYVPNNGATTISCTVWNSNRTASDTGSGTFYLDNVTPSVGVNVYGGAGANGWYYSAPGFSAAIYGDGPSGISSSGCSGIYQQGANSITCSATSGSGITGAGSTTVYYDSYTPYVNTSISGGSQANGWYSSAPSITPSPYNVGPSGVWYDSCTGLSNGVNSVTCSVTDVNGLGSTDGATTVKLDNQAPSNTVPSSTGTWYTTLGAVPSLPVHASEATNYSGLTSLSCTNPNNGSAGTYSLSQAVSAGASLSGTYPTSDLAIGTNSITCVSSTGAGKTASSNFTVLYDPQTPTVQISTSASSSAWYSSVGSIPGLSVSGTVGTSGVKSFTCSGDGISTQNYGSNTGGTISLTGLDQGTGTITCTLTANNGLSATATKTLNLDTAAPSVGFDTAEDGSTWYTHSDLPAVTVVGVTTGGSGIDHLTCNGDGLPSGYTINAASGSLPAGDLNQGTGQVTCSSTNGAGITSTAESLTINIDDTVPTASLSSSVDPSTWYQSDAAVPAINVSSTAGPSGIAWVYCSAPGVGDFIDSGSGRVDVSALKDGDDTVTCTPISNAGLSGSPVTVAVNVDSQAPTLTLSGPSQTKWYDAATNIPALVATATTGGSGVASIDCSGDGIANQTAAFNGATVDLTGLNQGTGTITCTLTSGSGRTSTQTFTLNLDGSAPTTSWSTTESQTSWYSSASAVPTLDATATTSGGSGVDHIACSGDGLTGTVTFPGPNATVDTSKLPNGSDTITCKSVSGAGVSGNAITRTIQIDNTAPEIALSGTDETTWYPAAQTVTADASTDTNPSGIRSISCAVDGGAPNVTTAATATQAVSGDGVHSVSCQPLSGAGVLGQTATSTVRIDSQTPSVTQTIVPAGPSAPAGTVAVQVSASENTSLSGIASTSCSLDGGTPTVASGDQQTVSIGTAGAHSLDCTATTGAGITSSDVVQTYNVNADPTQFTLSYGTVAASWQTGPIPVPVALSGATSANYRSLTCSVNGSNPTTINGTSGTVTVAASGTDKLDCYATAANGADTASVQQLVRIDNQTPTASWSTSATPTGEQVTLLGSEATPLSGISSESCTIDGGAAQTSSSGLLRMQITGNGAHQLACTISTAAGMSATVSHTVTVDVPVSAPLTDSAPDPGRWYHTAQTVVIGIPASGPAVASVVCSIGGVSTTYAVTGSSVSVTVPAPGGNLQCYDVDATGAQSAPVTYPVHIDNQPPTGYFVQTGPSQAIVSVADPANGPGIQSVNVQYQVAGGQWTTIPSHYDPNTGDATASIPYALQQPGAAYTLQALAVDYAGNSGVINTMQDGSAASSSVPNPNAGATVTGGLYVGTVAPGSTGRMLKITRAYRTETHTTRIGGRKVVRRIKVAIIRKRYIVALNTAKLTQSLTTDYGQTISLTGTLTLASGNVGGQPVTIVQQSGRTLHRTTATTNSAGVFNVKLPTSGDRIVTYTVAGVTHTDRILEHGSVRLTLSPAGTRAAVSFAGATGKVCFRLQHRHGGRWVNVGRLLATNSHGRTQLTLPPPIDGGPATALRVVVKTQAAWEYLNLKAHS